MFPMPTTRAAKFRLCAAILWTDMLAGRTSLTGVLWVDQHNLSTEPGLLVFQLSSEFKPTLVQNRLIQSCFRSHVFPRLLFGPLCRCAHVADFQVLKHDHRVVFADGCRGLVQKIVPSVGNPGVQPGYLRFLLLPIVAELLLFGQTALVFCEIIFQFTKTVQRRNNASSGQCGKVSYTNIDANNRRGWMLWLACLDLSLDRYVPMVSTSRHGDVLGFSNDFSALSKSNPTDLRQKYPIAQDFESLGIAERIVATPFLESRKSFWIRFIESIFQRPVQIFECLLQWLRMRLFKKGRIGVLFPCFEISAHLRITNAFSRFIQGLFLHSQSFIPNETRTSSCFRQFARDVLVYFELKFECFEHQHSRRISNVYVIYKLA